MAVLEIKKYPDKVLSEKTAPVNEFGSELQKLIDDMIETMYAAPGVGLAANQVGVSKRVAVIDVNVTDEKGSLIVLVNPEIVHKEGANDSEEGCLSIPGYTTVVKRADKVKVEGLDRHGRPIEARALQHEIDHLDGLLLIDRIGRIKREFFKKRYAKEKILSGE
jgi:peptide deformylase